MNKQSIQLWLLFAASLYFVIAEIGGLNYALEVVGVLVLLAFLVTISIRRDAKFYDGQIQVETNEAGVKVFSLLIEDDPEDLEQKDLVRFKIVSTSE